MYLSFKHTTLKCLILLISLQILNLGIDAIDFQPINTSKTIGNFNYMNSMTEYVAEIILGVKDAFPEYQKESSSSKSQILKHFPIKICQHEFETDRKKMNEVFSSYLKPKNETFNCLTLNEINLPPPKA